MNRRRERRQQCISRRKAVLARKLLLAALTVLCAGAAFVWMFGEEDMVSAGSTQSGLAYLTELEQRKTEPIEENIRKIRKQERRNALESGELSVWEQFADSAILGDSRVTGFSYWQFLDTERVMAYSGARLGRIEEKGYLEKLKDLNPANVFLSFGLNDISSGVWRDTQSCTADLEKNIAKIKTVLPESRIYINSILPVQQKALARCPEWAKVPELNEVIRTFCEANGYGYIDNAAIVAEKGGLFAADGIHMKSGFYPLWAVNMVAEVYEDEE